MDPRADTAGDTAGLQIKSDPLLGLNEGKQQEHQGEKQKTTAKLTTGYEQL